MKIWLENGAKSKFNSDQREARLRVIICDSHSLIKHLINN